MKRYRPHGLAFLGLTLCVFVAPAGGGEPRAAARHATASPKSQTVKAVNASPPVACIVVVENYRTKLQRLKFVLDDGIEMAKAFKRLGYEVRFVTDSGSIAKARDVMKGGTITDVREQDTDEKLFSEIRLWLKDAAAAKAPLAILVLAGHGEQRLVAKTNGKPSGADDFFLARADESGRGGVSLASICDAAAEHAGLPAVVVYDACRVLVNQTLIVTSADAAAFAAGRPGSFKIITACAQPASLSIAGDLPQGLTFVDNGDGTGTVGGTPSASALGKYLMTVRATTGPETATQRLTVTVTPEAGTGATRLPTGNPPPTVVYSTRPGEIANDKKSLIWSLTAGLKYDDRMKQFLRWHHTFPQGDVFDMTLFHGYYMGTTGSLWSHAGTQFPDIKYSPGAPATTAVYRVNGDKARPPDSSRPVVDLLNQFRPTIGKLTATFDPPTGLTIVRPRGLAAGLYSLGPLDKPGHDVSGRMLAMDVVATATGVKAGPSKPRIIYFDVETQYNGGGKRPSQSASVVLGPLVRLKFPLSTNLDPNTNAPCRLTGLCMNAEKQNKNVDDPWPECAELKLVELKLVEPKLVPQGAKPVTAVDSQQPAQDLLARWYLDASSQSNPFVPHYPRATGKPLRLTSAGGAVGWAGGELYPRAYAPPSSVLVLDVAGASPNAKVRLELQYRDPITGRTHSLLQEEGLIRPAAGRHEIPITHPGYANYLILHTDASSISISGMEIKLPVDRKSRP